MRRSGPLARSMISPMWKPASATSKCRPGRGRRQVDLVGCSLRKPVPPMTSGVTRVGVIMGVAGCDGAWSMAMVMRPAQAGADARQVISGSRAAPRLTSMARRPSPSSRWSFGSKPSAAKVTGRALVAEVGDRPRRRWGRRAGSGWDGLGQLVGGLAQLVGVGLGLLDLGGQRSWRGPALAGAPRGGLPDGLRDGLLLGTQLLERLLGLAPCGVGLQDPVDEGGVGAPGDLGIAGRLGLSRSAQIDHGRHRTFYWRGRGRAVPDLRP